jgi:hypothetical protein
MASASVTRHSHSVLQNTILQFIDNGFNLTYHSAGSEKLFVFHYEKYFDYGNGGIHVALGKNFVQGMA